MLSQNDSRELVHDRLFPLYRSQRTELDVFPPQPEQLTLGE